MLFFLFKFQSNFRHKIIFEILSIFRYVGNLDKRVTDVMMTNILRTGLPHISDKILSAKMFAPSDPVS